MRLIEAAIPRSSESTVRAMVEDAGAVDFWSFSCSEEDRMTFRVLMHQRTSQGLIDNLHRIMVPDDHWRIVVLPVQATLPEEVEEENGDDPRPNSVIREELYTNVAKGAKLDGMFLTLTVLSTVVAAIGLNTNSAAVVIGAMLIAPLLGPNLALSLAATLGDKDLMLRSIKTNGVGVALSLVCALAIGTVLEVDLGSQELLMRSDVGLAAIALALASGAAAALSLLTGLSSSLVGVMISVALLPPAVATGMFAGNGAVGLALGGAMLLAVNVACVNVAAQTVFLIKGVAPRTWLEKRAAQRSRITSLLFWGGVILVLVGLLYLRRLLG